MKKILLRAKSYIKGPIIRPQWLYYGIKAKMDYPSL